MLSYAFAFQVAMIYIWQKRMLKYSLLISKTLVVSHEKRSILTHFILDFLHQRKLHNHSRHTNVAQIYIPFLSYVEWLHGVAITLPISLYISRRIG